MTLRKAVYNQCELENREVVKGIEYFICTRATESTETASSKTSNKSSPNLFSKQSIEHKGIYL